MGIGRQVASSTRLDRYLAWADAYGFRILEHPDHGGVHPVHTSGSWHYDGLAADINYGPPGAPPEEMPQLAYAAEVAQSMGLGVILALRGTQGSAASHRDHLHVDCGASTNLGDRYTSTPRGDRKVQRSQRELHFRMAQRDNLHGPNTDDRWEAVRHASRYHGVKFPHGKKLAQRAVGVHDDGVWGAKSRAGHDATTAELQDILGVPDDGAWGPVTDGAYLDLRREKKR